MAVELTIWTDGPRAPTVAAILERMHPHVTPIGVGGPPPEATGAADELAATLSCHRRDDLRQLIVERPPAFLLLATMRSVDSADLLAATAQGTTVLLLEPAAAELQQLAPLKSQSTGRGRSEKNGAAGHMTMPARIAYLPDFRQCPGFLSAAEPFEAIGDRRVVSFQNTGPMAEGSLFARLFDAWRTVLHFTEQPESIAAALVGPDVVPDRLRGLAGAFAAQARMPDGSAAVVHVADQAAQTERRLHVLGDAGELHVSDGGYGLWQLDGTVLDQDHPGARLDYPELVARQWQRLIDRPTVSPQEPPHIDSLALACCLACLLSARTAQPESPGRVLEMNR